MNPANTLPGEAAPPARRALVSGATGYIGSNLTRALLRDGWAVHGLTRRDPSSHGGSSDITWHRYEGTTESVAQAVAQSVPDVVFHLAAHAVADHTPSDVAPLIASNVLLGTQLLDAMVQQGSRCFVNTGTFWQFFDGPHYNPTCLYAATKQAFQNISDYYVETLGFRVTTLYLFDVYGPNDPRPKLLNHLLKAVVDRTPLALSLGEQLIDLVHIDDVVAAFLLAAERLRASQTAMNDRYFVTTRHPISLRALVEQIREEADMPVEVQWGARPYRRREVMRPFVDGAVVPEWQPKVPLRAGLRSLLALATAERT